LAGSLLGRSPNSPGRHPSRFNSASAGPADHMMRINRTRIPEFRPGRGGRRGARLGLRRSITALRRGPACKSCRHLWVLVLQSNSRSRPPAG
jgi:hypothetical protein